MKHTLLPLAAIAFAAYTKASPVSLADLTPTTGTEALLTAEVHDIGHLTYDHGLQVDGTSELVYRVPAGMKRFEAWVGRDMATPAARLRFQVFADDALAFDSGWRDYHDSSLGKPLVNAERAMRVSIPLQGVRRLRLVTDGKGRANWAEAVFIPEGQSLWTAPPRKDDGLAPTPPMGWNSWNRFSFDVTEKDCLEIVDAVVASGMKDAGYLYITLDDLHGQEAKNFPKGLKHCADYTHSKGLRFGMYAQGELRDQGVPDVDELAAIGVDFLKYDFSTREQNLELAEAIRANGRPIILSTSEWGRARPWEWAPRQGSQMWRVTYDVVDQWQSALDTNRGGIGIVNAIDQTEALGRFTGPGQWNDPDMLVVGLYNIRSPHRQDRGCTWIEYRTQFSMWCMLSAPLIAGNDLRTMTDVTRETLTNREAIAVNQDTLGIMAWRCRKLGDKEVWIKPLADGDIAVALFNRGAETTTIEARWPDLDLTLPHEVRDLWAHQDLGIREESVKLEVRSHETRLLRLTPAG